MAQTFNSGDSHLALPFPKGKDWTFRFLVGLNILIQKRASGLAVPMDFVVGIFGDLTDFSIFQRLIEAAVVLSCDRHESIGIQVKLLYEMDSKLEKAAVSFPVLGWSPTGLIGSRPL